MRLTIVGCSGSFPSPESPASCYLLRAEDAAGRTWSMVIDVGSGAFGPLQAHIDPAAIDLVVVTHLHPDHCADVAGIQVYTKYHPAGRLPPMPMRAPAAAWRVFSRTYEAAGIYVTPYVDLSRLTEQEFELGPFRVSPRLVSHPVETYGLRISGPSERGGEAVLAFTADTDDCPALDALAADADLLLAEASYVTGRDAAPGIHLTGAQAGALAARANARRLVLTHLVEWNDPAITEAEAKSRYDGPIALARPGETHVI